MKKSLLALAVLGVAAGAAHAASSVTLYGVAEVAYTDGSRDNMAVRQGAPGETRVGLKGNEDLGNGMAAIFQFESRFNLDTGMNAGSTTGSGFFDEQSWVGLSFANGAHKVRFGRSATPLDAINNNIGHLVTDYGTNSSMGRWSNGAFYDFSANGWSAGAAVATKGGGAGDANEGVKGTKPSYGAYVKYAAPMWYASAIWQADNDNVAATGPYKGFMGVKNEWMVNGGVTFNPVKVGVSYARAKLYSDVFGGAFEGGGKRTTWHANVSADLTPNDTIYVNYRNIKGKGNSGLVLDKRNTYGLGYIHRLSKRTSVFAAVARDNIKVGAPTVAGGKVVSTTGSGKQTLWDVGVRHTF